MAKKSTEAQVKKHLTKIRQIDGGWEAMLDILYRRRIIAMLREVRQSKGMTQAQAAAAMGVTQGRIAEIENEVFPDPLITTLASYAHALGAELVIEARPLPQEPEAAEDEPQHAHTEPEKGCPVQWCSYELPHSHKAAGKVSPPDLAQDHQ